MAKKIKGIHISKELVKDFLARQGYLWDGKVREDNSDNWIDAKDNTFDGSSYFMNLVTLEGKKLNKVSVNEIMFEIDGVEQDDDKHRPGKFLYLEKDLFVEWMKYLVSHYESIHEYEIGESVRDYCIDEMKKISQRYEEEINALKEEFRKETKHYKEVLNYIENNTITDVKTFVKSKKIMK